MRFSHWSSDVCSSDLGLRGAAVLAGVVLGQVAQAEHGDPVEVLGWLVEGGGGAGLCCHGGCATEPEQGDGQEATGRREARSWQAGHGFRGRLRRDRPRRSEEHTSELQSLMRISYAVFCLKKKK